MAPCWCILFGQLHLGLLEIHFLVLVVGSSMRSDSLKHFKTIFNNNICGDFQVTYELSRIFWSYHPGFCNWNFHIPNLRTDLQSYLCYTVVFSVIYVYFFQLILPCWNSLDVSEKTCETVGRQTKTEYMRIGEMRGKESPEAC